MTPELLAHAKRLKRELRAARALRQKSKAVATRKAVFSRNGDRVRADDKSAVCFVVRVVGLNKAGRKAWRHFLKTSGIAYVPCEFSREPIAGACVKRLRDDTLASAFMCWGSRKAFRGVFCHKFVTGIERPGTVGNRLTNTLGRKRTLRPGPKNHRPAGTRMFVVGVERDADKKIVPVWTMERCK